MEIMRSVLRLETVNISAAAVIATSAFIVSLAKVIYSDSQVADFIRRTRH